MKLTKEQLVKMIKEETKVALKEQMDEAKLTALKKKKARVRYKELVKLLFQLSKHHSLDGFDYPDYGGLPKKWSNSLLGPEVDTIQDHTSYHEGKIEPKELYRDLVERFDSGYMQDWD